MKENTIKKIENEIDQKSKLPLKVKNKIKKEVLINILIGIIIELYLTFIIFGSNGTIKNVRAIDINIFSILFLITALTLLELAYRKDSGRLAFFGMEFLCFATFNLFLPYIIFELFEMRILI